MTADSFLTMKHENFQLHGLSKTDILDADFICKDEKIHISLLALLKNATSTSEMFINWDAKVIHIKKRGSCIVHFGEML